MGFKNSLLVVVFLGAMVSSGFALGENTDGLRHLPNTTLKIVADRNPEVKVKTQEEKCKSRGDDGIFFSGNERPLVSAPSCDLKRKKSSADELSENLNSILRDEQKDVFSLPIFNAKVHNGDDIELFVGVPILENGKLSFDLTKNFHPKEKDSINILGYDQIFDKIKVDSKSFDGPREIRSLMKVDNDLYIDELTNLVYGQIDKIQKENPEKKIVGLEFQINNNLGLTITDLTKDGLKTFFQDNGISSNLDSDTYKVNVLFENNSSSSSNDQKEKNFYELVFNRQKTEQIAKGITGELFAILDVTSDKKPELVYKGSDGNFYVIEIIGEKYSINHEFLGYYTGSFFERGLDLLIYRSMI